MTPSRSPRPEAGFDLLVLGGGSGGLAGAFAAAAHGARVALLEPGPLGGTCVNAGCVPKKAMWLAADMAERLALAADLGFDLPATPPVLDWLTFIAHRQRYIGQIHASYRHRLDAAGIVLMPCRGRLRDAHTVETDTGVRLRTDRVLLATGARPQRPDIPGVELAGTSDDFFELARAPGRVALVGGGYIAVELAGVLQALGSRVEVFARGPRLLSHMDAEVVLALQASLQARGVRLHLEAPVHALQPGAGGGIRVLHKGQDAGAAAEPFDCVLLATGRRPDTGGLGLEEAGVALGERGEVLVDEWQDTSLPGVHAVGDVTGKLALTPVAIAAARRLMARLFGGQADAKLDYDNVPTVVFSHPPLATVGLTEEQARARHGTVRVYTSGFRSMLAALADAPQRSLFKLVCVGVEERVVGIHLLGEAADEILQGFAVALKLGVTRAQLRQTVAIHPTSAEELVLAGQ
jgi:Pyruvate/2-oxoglutarate dehydrogenase complex, dihydrolipoamide dehydrogenase (E3) component, and related enzymes